MNSRDLDDRMLAALSVLIIVASAAIEYYSPHGVYLGSGYAIAVMLTFYSEGRRNAFVMAGISFLVVLFSIFFIHNNEDFGIVVANHAFSIIGIIVATVVVLYIKGLQQQAEKDNKQVNSLFQHAAEGIIVTNRTGEMVLVNPLAEQMFGYNKNELVGRKIEMLIPEGTRPKHIAHRAHFHEAPVNRTMGEGRDLYAMRKDGKVFPVEISLSQYKLGKEVYVTAFIIDISVRKKSQQELFAQKQELERVSDEIKKLNYDLEQKVHDRTMMLRETLAQLERSKDDLSMALEREKELGDLKSRFVSTVSHEFRTPLSTILSSANLINRYEEKDDQEKREKHVARIRDSVKHMNAMLEDLLSLGRLEEGLVEAKPEVFELRNFMVDFVAEMSEIARKGQKISYMEKGESMVISDRRLLKNVLINLTSNAIKFSPEDSLIEISAVNEGGQLVISVKDSGIGISDEDQAHLFERFFRARNASNIQGTGLGLHIISKYLELLKGSINLQSKINEGSTFIISIPSL